MRRLAASLLGTGLILGRLRGSDRGSGTVGAVFALALSLWLGGLAGPPAQLAAAAGLILLSLWAAAPYARDGGDPGWVVVDEAAGSLLATVGLLGWPALAAFVVFRLADIFKRVFPGVAAAERLPGTWGVVADDLVAALYGLVVGHLLQAL